MIKFYIGLLLGLCILLTDGCMLQSQPECTEQTETAVQALVIIKQQEFVINMLARDLNNMSRACLELRNEYEQYKQNHPDL